MPRIGQHGASSTQFTAPRNTARNSLHSKGFRAWSGNKRYVNSLERVAGKSTGGKGFRGVSKADNKDETGWESDFVGYSKSPRTMDVVGKDEDVEPVLWVYRDGELTALKTKKRIGF